MPHLLLNALGSRGHRVRSIFGLFLLSGLALSACVGEPADERVAEQAGGIINGAPDTNHPAVVALFSNNGACTGTIIHTDPGQGIGHVLTAAHCGNLVEVRMGNNYQNPSAVFAVIDWANHPNYDSQSQLFDFKMVRITGVSGSTPVIPAMTPAQDNLGGGTQVRHVGYGKSGPAPGSSNTIRRHILGNLSGVNSTHIFYNQPNGGPCSGDSGGPQLTVGGSELVAGVISYGDGNCAQAGASGRVSGVYDTFIVPYINNAPTGPLTCDQCFQSSTSGQGSCAGLVNACINSNSCSTLLDCFQACGNSGICAQGCIDDNPAGWAEYSQIIDCVCDTGCPAECGDEAFCNAGGTTAATTSATSGTTTATSTGAGGSSAVGVGGSGAGSEAWSSGDMEDESFNGYVFSSCSAAAAGSTGAGWWLLLGLAGLGLGRRRRG